MIINIHEPLKRKQEKQPILTRVIDKRTKSMYAALIFAGLSLIWGECGYPWYHDGMLCFYDAPFHELLVRLIAW